MSADVQPKSDAASLRASRDPVVDRLRTLVKSAGRALEHAEKMRLPEDVPGQRQNRMEQCAADVALTGKYVAECAYELHLELMRGGR